MNHRTFLQATNSIVISSGATNHLHQLTHEAVQCAKETTSYFECGENPDVQVASRIAGYNPGVQWRKNVLHRLHYIVD
jgi:hypothetical protein